MKILHCAGQTGELHRMRGTRDLARTVLSLKNSAGHVVLGILPSQMKQDLFGGNFSRLMIGVSSGPAETSSTFANNSGS